MKGIIMPAHYDATDNLYVMAWGRKKAYIGDPGQLDDMYRKVRVSIVLCVVV